MEKYEKPGERLVSKVPNKEYKDNYDKIFGEKESWLDRRERENMAKVVCPKCQKDWTGVQGYVCGDVGCPIQLKAT